MTRTQSYRLTDQELAEYVPLQHIDAPDYLINPNNGYVCHKKMKKRLGFIEENGYVKCTLKKLGTCYNHRLLYIHHHGVIPDGFEVDHIDKNRSNNVLNNLRILTISESRKHRNIINTKHEKGKAVQPKSIKAYKVDAKGVIDEPTCKTFQSMRMAAHDLGVNIGAISQIVNKNSPSGHNYYHKTYSNKDKCYFTFVAAN